MTNLNQENLRKDKSIYEGTEEIESTNFDRMRCQFPGIQEVIM